MLTFEFSMNVILLFAIIVVAAYVGFRFRSGLIAKSRIQVASLEREMVNNHAEILELQKEYLVLQLKFDALANKAASQPAKTEIIHEKLPDTSHRKKLRNKNIIDPTINEGYNLNYNGLVSNEVPVASVQY